MHYLPIINFITASGKHGCRFDIEYFNKNDLNPFYLYSIQKKNGEGEVFSYTGFTHNGKRIHDKISQLSLN